MAAPSAPPCARGGSLSTGIGASYGVFALKGDGKAGWVRMATPLPEFGQELTWGLAIGDVNADKRPDLVVTLGGAGAKPAKDREAAAKAQKFPHVQVWLNQGRPNDGSQAGTTTRPGAAVHGVGMNFSWVAR